MSIYFSRVYDTYGSYAAYTTHLEDLDERTRWLAYGGSHLDPLPSAESFLTSINAFASIVSPRDPDTAGETPESLNDIAAGDLSLEVVNDPISGIRIASFAVQFLRMVDLVEDAPSPPQDLANISRHDVISLFSELDYQAVNSALITNEASFVALTAADQLTLMTAIQAGSVVPGTIPGGTANLLKTLQNINVALVNTTAGLNYPEHRISIDSESGYGGPNGISRMPPGRPAFTDVPNQITSPNVPGTGTAYDYTGSYYPLKKGVEDRVWMSMVQAQADAAASETALAALLTDDMARTLVKEA